MSHTRQRRSKRNGKRARLCDRHLKIDRERAMVEQGALRLGLTAP